MAWGIYNGNTAGTFGVARSTSAFLLQNWRSRMIPSEHQGRISRLSEF